MKRIEIVTQIVAALACENIYKTNYGLGFNTAIIDCAERIADAILENDAIYKEHSMDGPVELMGG